MIDSRLLRFLEHPESEKIVEAFNNLPQRHLATVMAVLSSLSESAPIGLLSSKPFLSETVEGRVVERKLRGETLPQIMKSENLSRDEALSYLLKARDEGVKVGKLGQVTKPEKFNKVTDKMKVEFVDLRKRGIGPSIIAKHFNVRPNAVSNIIYAAKMAGETFREIDKSLTEITTPISVVVPVNDLASV